MAKIKNPIVRAGDDWNFKMLEQLSDIGAGYMKELGFTYYPLQIEIVSANQMMGLYASDALPFGYNHWSFGEEYLTTKQDFLAGKSGLAFEICKFSDPCLCFNMETNNAVEQASVIFHVYGHSSHFASNYLYRNNSNPKFIIPYMDYARKFIKACEDKYGIIEVERILDLAHALQTNAINKFDRKNVDEEQKMLDRELYRIQHHDSILDALLENKNAKATVFDPDNQFSFSPNLPEENILYFVEKHSPVLTNWQREIVRIVRIIAQFSNLHLVPQSKFMAEGTAMFVEKYLMSRAHEDGYIDEGSYLEYLRMNSRVLTQYDLDGKRLANPFWAIMQHGKLNPYYFGLAMMEDIKRMAQNPTEEDIRFCPDVCGQPWENVLSDVITNYRDDSFILQFLSPHLIRQIGLTHARYDNRLPGELHIMSHAEHPKDIRKAVAESCQLVEYFPNIEIVLANSEGITLNYYPHKNRKLHDMYTDMVDLYLAELMGTEVYTVSG